MINRNLHILTNKKGPFEFVQAAADPNFAPKKLSAEQVRFRKQLFLDRHEFYAEMILCAMQAYPDINPDTYPEFDYRQVPPTGVTVQGAEFLVEKNLLGQHIQSSTFPFNFSYNVLLTLPSTARLSATESGLNVTTSFQASGVDPEKIIHIAWPAEFPFEGPMKMQQPLVTNAQITINVRPFKPPYSTLVTRAAGNSYLSERLGKMGLLEEYHTSEDPVEKTAIIGAVIINDY